MASVRSLDNALETNWGTTAAPNMQKITKDDGSTIIPDNGRIIRNLIHGADTVMSHITHFYHLAALDFVDASSLGAPFSPTYTTSIALSALLPGSYTMHNGQSVVSNYVEALAMRRKMHSAGAIFSGRQPIQNAVVPGGVTTIPTASDVVKFSNLLDQVRNFINTAYIPDVVTIANAYGAYWTLGTQPGNLLSYGEYPIQSGSTAETLLLTRGLVSGLAITVTGGPTSFLSNISEFVGYSFYEKGVLNVNDNKHPFDGVTIPRVDYVVPKTSGRYSWLKAPRFGTTVCEVGPISRMVASYLATNPAVVSDASGVTSGVTVTGLAAGATYNVTGLVGIAAGLLNPPFAGASSLVSILGRHACRALETKLVADAMADTGLAKANGEAWLTELRAGTAGDTTGTVFTNLTNPVYIYGKLPTRPKQGAGWAEAPRGALGHWIKIENKRIKNYQCVVPSTWNHSPRDSNNNSGACEQVLQGLPVGLVDALLGSTNDDLDVNILRVLHTYDFCIACAVHVVKPDGSTILKFKMETDGRVTKLPHDAEI
jgi:hydrogenase large subunit